VLNNNLEKKENHVLKLIDRKQPKNKFVNILIMFLY